MAYTFINPCITTVTLVMTVWANRYSAPYSCYADVCNQNSSAQFCYVALRTCRGCEESRDECFTKMHVDNCTKYCLVEGCSVPPPPRNGRYSTKLIHVPIDTTLEVVCDEGYIIRNEDPMKCSNFSMWAGSKPACEASSTPDTLNRIQGMLYVLIVGVVVIIIIQTKNMWLPLVSCNRKLTTTTDDNEQMSFIADENGAISKEPTTTETATQTETSAHKKPLIDLPPTEVGPHRLGASIPDPPSLCSDDGQQEDTSGVISLGSKSKF